MKPTLLLAAVGIVIWAPPVLGQTMTTGALTVTVESEMAAAQPGTILLLETPSGVRETTLGTDGSSTFHLLDPGTYRLEIRLPDQEPVIVTSVLVRIGRTTRVLVPGGGDAGATGGAAIAVDAGPGSAGVGTSLAVERLSAHVPVGRELGDLFLVSPEAAAAGTGLNAGGFLDANPSISGTSGLDNRYLIQGLDVTHGGLGSHGTFNPILGALGPGLTTDFFDAVHVGASGFDAGIGSVSGGVLSSTLRRGTNEFGGSVGVHHSSASFEGSREQARPAFTGVGVEGVDRLDLTAQVHGPLVKDRLFFFVGYGRVATNTSLRARFDPVDASPGAILTDGEVDQQRVADTYAARLTWQARPDHRLDLFLFGDPSDGDLGPQREDALLVPAVVGPTRFTRLSYGSHNLGLSYQGVLGGRTLLDVVIGRHDGGFREAGRGTELRRLLDTQVAGGLSSGGVGAFFDQDDESLQASVRITQPLGRHGMRYGIVFQAVDYTESRRSSGPGYMSLHPVFNPDGTWTQTYVPIPTSSGARVERRTCTLGGPDCSDFDGDGEGDVFIVVRAPLSPVDSMAASRWWSAHWEGEWRVTDRLAVTTGLRHIQQDLESESGFDLPLPRGPAGPRPQTFPAGTYDFPGATAHLLGFQWQPLPEMPGRIYGQAARQHAVAPAALAIEAFTGRLDVTREEFLDPDLTVLRESRQCALPGGGFAPCSRPSVFGAPVTPPLPGTRLPYVDELVLGYTYDLTPHSTLDARLVFREQGRVLEDVQFSALEEVQNYYYASFDPNGPMTVPFPGFGSQPFQSLVLANPGKNTPPGFDDPERRYQALVLTYEHRPAGRWSLLAGYRYSRLEGNYEGLFRNDNGQAQPHTLELFDFPRTPLLEGQYRSGPLNLDIPHLLRVYGAYHLRPTVTLGAAVNAASGTGRAPLLAHPAYLSPGAWPGASPSYDPQEGILISYVPVDRDVLGRTPSLFTVDLHVDWRPRLSRGGLHLALDVFNAFNAQKPVGFDDRLELRPGLFNPAFLRPVHYQPPRQVRLSAVWQF